MAASCGRAASARAPAHRASLGVGSPVTRRRRFPFGSRGPRLVDGRTAVLESRFSGDRYDRLPAIAAELVRLDVDVLVAAPAPAVIAAKAASGRIPIVMIGVADPVGQGLVASLARPGGNVTGLSFTVGTETFGKSLELLKETVPGLRRVAVLVNPANPAQALVRQDLAVAAEWLGLQLHAVEASGPEDFEGAFAAMAREGAGAVLIVGDPAFEAHNPRLADLGVRYGLASMHQLRHRVEAGGLMSYGPDIVDLWHRAGLRRQAPERRQPLRSADSAANHLRARREP